MSRCDSRKRSAPDCKDVRRSKPPAQRRGAEKCAEGCAKGCAEGSAQEVKGFEPSSQKAKWCWELSPYTEHVSGLVKEFVGQDPSSLVVSYLQLGKARQLISHVAEEYEFIASRTAVGVHVWFLQELLKSTQHFLPLATPYELWPLLEFKRLPIPLNVDLEQQVLDVFAGNINLWENAIQSDYWIKQVLVKRLQRALTCLCD